MIYIKNTPNYTGVTVYGDHFDFEELYNSLHTIIGDEGEWSGCKKIQLLYDGDKVNY